MTEVVSQQAVDAFVQSNPALERFVAAAIRIGELEIVDEKKVCENVNGNQKN
jgi:hypothetical protein